MIHGMHSKELTGAQATAQALLRSLYRFRKSGWFEKLHHFGDLSPVESMVLRTISHHTGGCGDPSEFITPSQIGERLEINSSTVTGHINRLEEKGFITREIDQNDRRVIRVAMTEAGWETVQKTFASTLGGFTSLVDHLGEEQSREMIRLIDESTDYFTKTLK